MSVISERYPKKKQFITDAFDTHPAILWSVRKMKQLIYSCRGNSQQRFKEFFWRYRFKMQIGKKFAQEKIRTTHDSVILKGTYTLQTSSLIKKNSLFKNVFPLWRKIIIGLNSFCLFNVSNKTTKLAAILTHFHSFRNFVWKMENN